MTIEEIHILSHSQLQDLHALMLELDPEIEVTDEMLLTAAAAPGTHLFLASDDNGMVVGCASLSVFDSPTGRKASIEDVVVGSQWRGLHIGRQLMEHILDYARRELGDVDIHLSSRPARTAANELYKTLGFKQRETNFYRLQIRSLK